MTNLTLYYIPGSSNAQIPVHLIKIQLEQFHIYFLGCFLRL